MQVIVALSWAVAGVTILILIVVVRRWRRGRLGRLAALSESGEYDILDLWTDHFVMPRATGQSITHVNAEVQNLTDKRFWVIIRPGTYFVSSGAHQNMVARTEHRFRLHERATERISVPASCIDAESPIPGPNDRFSGVARVSNNLTRFLQRAKGEDAMVIQAAVWALTDGYSKCDIQNKLTAQSSYGDTRPAISDQQVIRAKRLLDELEIGHFL